jgi:hypothetical protein
MFENYVVDEIQSRKLWDEDYGKKSIKVQEIISALNSAIEKLK